jgi:hypothetical protein
MTPGSIRVWTVLQEMISHRLARETLPNMPHDLCCRCRNGPKAVESQDKQIEAIAFRQDVQNARLNTCDPPLEEGKPRVAMITWPHSNVFNSLHKWLQDRYKLDSAWFLSTCEDPLNYSPRGIVSSMLGIYTT